MTTIFQDVNKLHIRGNTSSDAQEVLKLLKSVATIDHLTVQENGDCIYVQYDTDARYFNMHEVTPILYNKYGIVIRAFDSQDNIDNGVWLATKSWMAKQ